MPHRSYASTANYRFGFNGKENDNESKGLGNQQDYGMRVYDPRIGKFLSVDPLLNSYPWNSPYSYAEGDPINYIDIDGAENGPSTAQGTRTPVIPKINITIDPELINGRSGGSVYRPSGQMFTTGKVNSETYAPQTRFITQEELYQRIPPNAGATLNPDGVSMTVHGPNGSWRVSLLKRVDQPSFTWVDRLVMRFWMEKTSQFSNSFKQWNVSVQAYEVITNEPSNLTDEYLQQVQRRLLSGNGTARDKIYESELRRRKQLYEINDKHNPNKPLGGSNASVIPNNHQQLWESRSYYDSKNDTWWAKEGTGKKSVYHRFSGDGNGAYHWSGSTGQNFNRNGYEVDPISPQNVPTELKRQKKP